MRMTKVLFRELEEGRWYELVSRRGVVSHRFIEFIVRSDDGTPLRVYWSDFEGAVSGIHKAAYSAAYAECLPVPESYLGEAYLEDAR